MDAHAGVLVPGTLLDGRYRVVSPIGRGGMGHVYRAEQITIGRPVALKVLRRELAQDPRAVVRFQREAQAVSALSHPNIVTIHDFGQLPDASLFLALEFIDGRPLAELVRVGGPMQPARVVAIGVQILSALESAHEQGVIHRDLKPENILISHHAGAADFVKVVDFGLAHVKAETAVTRTGEVFGTPSYLSPEQSRGWKVDHRTDLYSMGVLLFELLVGRPPFESNSNVALLMAHIRNPPPRFSALGLSLDIPEALEQLVYRALEKAPEARFQSAAEMRDALLATLSGSGDGSSAANETVPFDLSLLMKQQQTSGLEQTLPPVDASPQHGDAHLRVVPRAAQKVAPPASVVEDPLEMSDSLLSLAGQSALSRRRGVIVAAAGVALLGSLIWVMARTDAPSAAGAKLKGAQDGVAETSAPSAPAAETAAPAVSPAPPAPAPPAAPAPEPAVAGPAVAEPAVAEPSQHAAAQPRAVQEEEPEAKVPAPRPAQPSAEAPPRKKPAPRRARPPRPAAPAPQPAAPSPNVLQDLK